MRASRGVRALVAAAAAAAACTAAGSAFAGGGPNGPTFGYGRYVREARAFRFCLSYDQTQARYRTCLSGQALALVLGTHDPARELPRIDRYAHSVGGFLDANCHILMHPVGRGYARRIHLTLARLRDYLPRTNDRRLRSPGPGRRGGLRPGRVPRLLDRGRRARPDPQAEGHDDLPAEALRRSARAVRSRLLVPRLPRAPAEANPGQRTRPPRPLPRAEGAPARVVRDRRLANRLGRPVRPAHRLQAAARSRRGGLRPRRPRPVGRLEPAPRPGSPAQGVRRFRPRGPARVLLVAR